MLKQFESLSKEDRQIMMDAIPLVTILIAGADGKIDKKETERAARIQKVRSYDAAKELAPYYKEVGKTFDNRLNELLAELPAGLEKRQEAISQRLAKLNDVFTKVDHFYAKNFYDDLLSFSDHVAKSSGGILGFLSVSDAENDWVTLPMIVKPEV